MFVWMLGPVRFLAKALVADDSPKQLALGCVIGMVLGLVPKGNLTAIGLAWLLFGTRVNLGTGLAAAAFFSWIGWAIDPFAHKLGWIVLSYQPFQSVYAALYDLPLVAWTGWNNTVVTGQLLIGFYLAYPAYRVSLSLFTRIRPWAAAQIRKYRVTQILFGLDFGTRWELN